MLLESCVPVSGTSGVFFSYNMKTAYEQYWTCNILFNNFAPTKIKTKVSQSVHSEAIWFMAVWECQWHKVVTNVNWWVVHKSAKHTLYTGELSWPHDWPHGHATNGHAIQKHKSSSMVNHFTSLLTLSEFTPFFSHPFARPFSQQDLTYFVPSLMCV